MNQRSTLRLLVALALSTGLFLLHCDDGPSSPGAGGAGGEVALPEVIYDGRASDEALARVWDRLATAEPDAAKAPTMIVPANGATVPAAPPSDLAWELAIASALPAPAAAPPASRAFPRLALGPAVAHAHLPPVTGFVYLAEITPHGGSVIRLFTTNLRWTPDATTWAAIVAGGGASIRIWDTYLNENVVEEGPYVMPEAASFTVSP